MGWPIYSNHLDTGLVWDLDGRFVSGCQMVRHQMVVWKPVWKSLFMVQNVRYTNGLPSHMILPFEYRTPILSGIQVFGIQMVTVVEFVDKRVNWMFVICIPCVTHSNYVEWIKGIGGNIKRWNLFCKPRSQTCCRGCLQTWWFPLHQLITHFRLWPAHRKWQSNRDASLHRQHDPGKF